MDKTLIFPLMPIRTAGLPLSILEAPEIPWASHIQTLRDARQLENDCSSALQNTFDQTLQQVPVSDFRQQLFNARKLFFEKKQLKNSWLKQTDIPENLQTVTSQWLKAKEQVAALEQNLAEVYQKGLQAQFRALQQHCQHPDFQRSLMFSSLNLLQAIPDFIQADVAHLNKKNKQRALGIAQYLYRAATKTSPFSRFTTLSVWSAEQATLEADNPFQDIRPIVTPNVALLPALYEVLLQEPGFYESLTVRLNPCILEDPGNGQILEWLYFDGEQECFQQATADPLLSALVQHFLEKDRHLKWTHIQSWLLDTADTKPETARDYLFQWIDTGLLEWEWPEAGLSASWPGSLYRYLGFLPGTNCIVEAASLLQWLRTAARVLPFQDQAAAIQTLQDTQNQIQTYFNTYQQDVPDIPLEQLFFEDSTCEVQNSLPDGQIHTLSNAIAEIWRKEHRPILSEIQQRIQGILERLPPNQESISFLELAKRYSEGNRPQKDQKPVEATHQKGKIGVLLQFFNENGQWKAVVNGMFPGGGKMLVRCLHLLPESVSATWKKWLKSDPDLLVYPWQGWYNVNFQAASHDTVLQTPGSRLKPLANTILLGELQVKAGVFGPTLWANKQLITCTDLGLEAPATRPPVMQLLWEMAVPAVSLKALLKPVIPEKLPGDCLKFPRQETQNIVLSRARWHVPASCWEPLLGSKGYDFLIQFKDLCVKIKAPRYFFARFSGQKPQYFDQDSPLSMLLLEKLLNQSKGDLQLIEMLPLAQDAIVQRQQAKHASEWVLEIEV